LEKQLEYSSRESAREIARLRTKLFELEIGLAMTTNSDGTNSAANLFDDQMLQEIDFPQLPEFMRKEQDDHKQQEEQEQEQQLPVNNDLENNENRKLYEMDDNFSRSRNTILDTMKDTDTLNNNDYQRNSGNNSGGGGGAGVPRRKTVIHTGSYNQNNNQNNTKSATALAPASFIHPEENPTPLLPNMEFLRQESGIDIDRIPTPKELMRLENESLTKNSSRKSLAANKSEQELLDEIMNDIQKSPSKVSLAASSGKGGPNEKELMNEILNDINN
jgi:hypothetical protein